MKRPQTLSRTKTINYATKNIYRTKYIRSTISNKSQQVFIDHKTLTHKISLLIKSAHNKRLNTKYKRTNVRAAQGTSEQDHPTVTTKQMVGILFNQSDRFAPVKVEPQFRYNIGNEV